MTAKCFTPQQKEKIRREKANGATFKELAAKYGVHHSTIRRAVDDRYVRAQNIYQAKARRTDYEPFRNAACGLRVHHDALKRMAEIPEDTRDLTAYLMGDPIPNDWRRRQSGGSSHA